MLLNFSGILYMNHCMVQYMKNLIAYLNSFRAFMESIIIRHVLVFHPLPYLSQNVQKRNYKINIYKSPVSVTHDINTSSDFFYEFEQIFVLTINFEQISILPIEFKQFYEYLGHEWLLILCLKFFKKCRMQQIHQMFRNLYIWHIKNIRENIPLLYIE